MKRCHTLIEFRLTYLSAFLQNSHSPIRGHMFDDHIRSRLHNRTLLAPEKVPLVHMGHVRSTGLTPDAHFMGVLLRICFDRSCNASVRISFTEDGIHGASEDCSVAGFDGAFFVVRRFVGVKRNVIAFGAKFGDTGVELWYGSTNVRQFNNDCIRLGGM